MSRLYKFKKAPEELNDQYLNNPTQRHEIAKKIMVYDPKEGS